MSIAEQLRNEGIKEGEKRGEKKGELKKAREMAKNLIHLNMEEHQIIDVTGLKKKRLKKSRKPCNNNLLTEPFLFLLPSLNVLHFTKKNAIIKQ